MHRESIPKIRLHRATLHRETLHRETLHSVACVDCIERCLYRGTEGERVPEDAAMQERPPAANSRATSGIFQPLPSLPAIPHFNFFSESAVRVRADCVPFNLIP